MRNQNVLDKISSLVDVVEQPRSAGDRLMDVVVGGVIVTASFVAAGAIAPKVGDYEDPEANRGLLAARTALGATVGFVGGFIGAGRALNCLKSTEIVIVEKKKSRKAS